MKGTARPLYNKFMFFLNLSFAFYPHLVSHALVPEIESKGLDEVQLPYRKYSPVRGMLVHHNNWLKNIYTKFHEIDPTHPSYVLSRQLFTQVPGENELKSTSKNSVPAAILSGRLVGKIMEQLENEEKAYFHASNVGNDINPEENVKTLAIKLNNLIIISPEYQDALAGAKADIVTFEKIFADQTKDYEAGLLLIPEKDDLTKVKIGQLTMKLNDLKKQFISLGNPKGNDDKKKQDLKDNIEATEGQLNQFKESVAKLDQTIDEPTNKKMILLTAKLNGLRKQLKKMEGNDDRKSQEGPKGNDDEKKLELKDKIEISENQLNQYKERLTEIEKFIIPAKKYKEQRERHKYLMNSNAIGSEKYLKELSDLTTSLAQSFYKVDLNKSKLKKASSFFPLTTTTDMLLGYLWGKFTKKIDFHDYLQELQNQKMLTINNLDEKFYNDVYGEKDFRTLEKYLLTKTKTKDILFGKKRLQYLNKNWGLGLAYSILKPNAKNRPVVTVYKQYVLFNKDKIQFSNCSENALRNLISFFFFDQKTGNIDLQLFKDLQEKKNFKLSEKLIDFYTRHPLLNESNEYNYHVEWNDVVSDLNSPDEDEKTGVQYVNGQTKEKPLGSCEIKPNKEHFLRVYKKLFGTDPDSTMNAVNELRNRKIEKQVKSAMGTFGPASNHVYEDKVENFSMIVSFENGHVTSLKEDKDPGAHVNSTLKKINKLAKKKFLEITEESEINDLTRDFLSLDTSPLFYKATNRFPVPLREHAFRSLRDNVKLLLRVYNDYPNYNSHLPQLLAFKKDLVLANEARYLLDSPTSTHAPGILKRNLAIMDQLDPNSPLYLEMVKIIEQRKLKQYKNYLISRGTEKDTTICTR